MPKSFLSCLRNLIAALVLFALAIAGCNRSQPEPVADVATGETNGVQPAGSATGGPTTGGPTTGGPTTGGPTTGGQAAPAKADPFADLRKSFETDTARRPQAEIVAPISTPAAPPIAPPVNVPADSGFSGPVASSPANADGFDSSSAAAFPMPEALPSAIRPPVASETAGASPAFATGDPFRPYAPANSPTVETPIGAAASNPSGNSADVGQPAVAIEAPQPSRLSTLPNPPHEQPTQGNGANGGAVSVGSGEGFEPRRDAASSAATSSAPPGVWAPKAGSTGNPPSQRFAGSTTVGAPLRLPASESATPLPPPAAGEERSRIAITSTPGAQTGPTRSTVALPDISGSRSVGPAAPVSPTATGSAVAAKTPTEPVSTKIDPVKANGPIFEGWKKPKAALLISGLQHGYIEPCGCAGLENQKGGLKRRHTLLKQMAADGWPVAPIDVGGLILRYGMQQGIKYRSTVDALRKMGYQAVGFGPEDLRQPAVDLLQAAHPDNGYTPFVSANVGIYAFDENEVPRSKVIKVGGMRIGITSVLGEAYRKNISSADLVTIEAEKALAEVVPGLVKAKCDYLMLLSYDATKEQSARLAKRFPQFDFVVTAAGADEPPHEPTVVEGTKTTLIEVGHKGMFAVVIGFYDGKPAFRYQRVPLDSRFEDSKQMHNEMVAYQQQLEQLGLSGLEIKAAAHPTQNFVGSETCGECHTKAYGVWKKTPHAHATDSLVKLDPPRHFDPECLSCHVTGWEPQKFFPYKTGYLDLKTTPQMQHNGCENCHGPGATHAKVEAGELKLDAAKTKALRASMRTAHRGDHEAWKKAAADACMKCHDLDNSPHFDFDTYWPKVEHKGKG